MRINSNLANHAKTYLDTHLTKDMLRFITCGSVDDGKSTLIGRILYESNMLYDEELHALIRDSKTSHTSDGELDFSLLLDGLAAEREQGITIDVAYRFFSTLKRQFIVADTPGHEQYTHNMVTGCSTAELAILLIDARKGILTQTRRHSYIVSMLGIKHVILAINKMDLIQYDQLIFQETVNQYATFSESLGFKSVHAIPISALKGDNIIDASLNTPWYHGAPLLEYLECIDIESNLTQNQPFRMAVQWVNRAHLDFRGFTGRIAAGVLHKGDRIRVLPGHQETQISRIVTYDGDLEEAIAGQSVTCLLEDDIDVSRGTVFAEAKNPCDTSDQFNVTLLWMAETPMIVGRQYYFKTHTTTTICTPRKLKYRIDINTMEHLSAKELDRYDIGCCDISLNQSIAFEAYTQNRELGSFILVDKISNATVGAGLIHFALRRASNVHFHELSVNQAMRSCIKEQKPVVLWLTGLSGSGKSTIANCVEQELNAIGKHTILLDGDNLRKGLNQDLDFSETSRVENIRRAAEVAKLMAEAGLITIVALISPFAADRAMAREIIGKEQFVEIFIDAPLEVLEKQDIKGLYKKARAGEILNFTGISSPYEAPQFPDLRLDRTAFDLQDAVKQIIELLRERKII